MHVAEPQSTQRTQRKIPRESLYKGPMGEQKKPKFFGTDGIRDVAGKGRLTAENVSRIGHALSAFAADRAGDRTARVLLARDPRPSGEALTHLLAAHMRAAELEVVDGGVLPSPALAWLTAAHGYDLGLSLSASHNTPEYNGIKPFVSGGRKLTVEEELEIEAAMPSAPPSVEHHIPRHDAEARADYVHSTAEWLRRDGDLKGYDLIIDLSAGAASETAAECLEVLGATVRVLHAAGTRPINEGCGTENPEAWLNAVRGQRRAVGLAFDGDADRVLVADETGVALDGDDVLAILAADLHDRDGVPANAVVSTVMANLGLEEFLEPLGVRLERTAVGDRNVAERMLELGAVLGGEPAGHIVLPHGTAQGRVPLIGDGLVAGVRVLQAARRSGTKLKALRERRVRHPQVLENVRMGERVALDDWPAMQEVMAAQEAALQGIGRILVRYSGTEPLLRIMAEGRDPAAVQAAVDAMAAVARASV